MDLWMREARLFKYGSGTGTNFSSLRGENEKLSGGGKSSGLMSFLKIGDRAAGAIKSGGTTRRAAKMVIVDIDHPDIEDFIDWKVKEEQKVAALVTGSKIDQKHLKAHHEGLRQLRGLGRRLLRPGEEPGAQARDEGRAAQPRARQLHQARHPVRQAGLQGHRLSESTTPIGIAKPISPSRARTPTTRCASPTTSCKAVEADGDWDLTWRNKKGIAKTLKARDLWDKIGHAAWACADPGIQFHTTINDWHTCPASGPIRASNPCSEYMFLDDTACNLASLNLLQFRDPATASSSTSKASSMRVRLWTIVLEISVLMAQFPSKEIAQLSYDYRTLGLGFANIGGLLMSAGIPYDQRGRPRHLRRALRDHDRRLLCHLGRNGAAARAVPRLSRRTATTCCA